MKCIAKWTFAGLMMLMMSLPGCISYSTVSLDIMEPAGIKFPVEIASVVVVDNAYPVKDSAVHVINAPGRTYQIDSIYVDDFGKRVVEAMGTALESQQFFDSVHVAQNSLNPAGSGKPLQPLSFYQIDSLSHLYNAQAVISLDYYKYNTTTNMVDLSDYYYVTLDARSHTYWKIYDATSGEIMDIHPQSDTIFWEGEGSELNRAFNTLPEFREALKAVAAYSGSKYAKYVAPSWERVSRIYFKKGHPLFYDADRLVSQGNWEEAMTFWYKVYEEANKKQKARASFNLATGQEVMGNFREALAWAYRSVQHYKELGSLSVSQWERDQAQDYYVKLSIRLREKKKLDDQFGFDE